MLSTILAMFAGALIMFVGFMTGWTACSVEHKRGRDVVDPICREDAFYKAD